MYSLLAFQDEQDRASYPNGTSLILPNGDQGRLIMDYNTAMYNRSSLPNDFERYFAVSISSLQHGYIYFTTTQIMLLSLKSSSPDQNNIDLTTSLKVINIKLRPHFCLCYSATMSMIIVCIVVCANVFWESNAEATSWSKHELVTTMANHQAYNNVYAL